MAAIRRWLGRNWSAIACGIVALLLVVAVFKGWPYVIYQAGSAEPVHPRVETGHQLDEKGALLFTTVTTRSNPNIFQLLYARLNDRMDVTTEESATGGAVNMAAYRNLLAWMRDSSEAEALIAAYGALGREIEVDEEGVVVASFLDGTQARENGLQEGDIIKSADGRTIAKLEDLTDYLATRKIGDVVKLSGTRGDKPFEASVPLIQLDDAGRVGVGFGASSALKAMPPDPVKFSFDDIGGPSAGLMMTLEIVAQLEGKDLTHGYRIAGTGTIGADGSIGQIGGIQYKLMAADKEKADYFLVPYIESGNYGNWNDAEATVNKLNLKPQLVKVSSLQDALKFLNGLQDKQ